MVTVDQAQAQMAVWSIMPSALIFSHEVDKLSDEMEAILLNRQVIAVHQDPLGLSGYKVLNVNNFARTQLDTVASTLCVRAHGGHFCLL